MSTINKYPVFENNQVLTAGQLNSLASYLDEQTRISRTYLIGTGIVCGLEVTMQKAQNKIIISKGTGVTSEGFLISLGQCETTHYRPYEFPTGVSYPHFMSGATTMYPITELLTSESSSQEGVKGLNQFPDANWQNYVVVLFLEIYDKDLYSCFGKSCDEIGIDRIFTVRKLLIAKTDVQLIINKNAAETAPNKQPYRFLDQFNLPRAEMPRALLNYKNTDFVGPILWQYVGAATMIIEFLEECIKKAYDVFTLLLSRVFSDSPFAIYEMSNRVEFLKHTCFEYLKGRPGFQYFYDFISDLVIAYNEFCCAAAHLNNQCIPVEKSFPLHLMLGEIACPLSPLRQHFVSSPIINEQKEQNEKVRVLYQRIIAMLYSFDPEIEKLTEENDILITPSREKGTRLGERAIPVYYNPKAEIPYNYLLADVWNEESCLPCRTHNKIMAGYHSQKSYEKQTHPVSPAETPLYYSINDHSFFRIEGHIGQKEQLARKKLETYAREYNIDFNTLTLFVGSNGEVKSAKCVFSDLETDYAIWRNKMRYFLTNIVKATKKMENLSGLRSAFAKEVNIVKDKGKENTANPQATANNQPETVLHLYNSNDIVTSSSGGINTNIPENTTINANKTGFSSTNSYKGAYIGERLTNFKADKDTGGATSDEEELSNRIAQINVCLKSIIAAMPGDFEKFDFDTWCDAYRCALYKWVGIMEYIAFRLNQDLSSEKRAQFMLALTIMYVVDEILNFWLIYPYLTIATIHDTAERRLEKLKQIYTLSYTLKKDPGLEHTAGVYRGETFVLLAFAEQEKGGKGEKIKFDEKVVEKIIGPENDLFMEAFELYGKLEEEGAYADIAEKYKGMVFADLSGHVCCCDPCEDVDVDDYDVTPIAMPVTRILTPKKDASGSISYNKLNIHLLNNVYNPDTYEPFASGAAYGDITYKETEYIPEDDKKNKILVYTPDIEKIQQAIRDEKKIVVDSFEYHFTRKDSGETVSSAKIYIFINTMSVDDIPEPPQEQGTVRGDVGITVSEEQVACDLQSLTIDLGGQTYTNLTFNSKGNFSFKTAPGTYDMVVTVIDKNYGNFPPRTQSVTVTANASTTVHYAFSK